MRPIDGDALIDAMTGACNIFDAHGADTTLARTLITIVDKALTIGGWISVKDGKPPSIREPHYRDVFRPVFLYTKNDNSVYVGWYLGEDYRGIDCYISRTSMNSYQHITKKITHWMPLPEPPET